MKTIGLARGRAAHRLLGDRRYRVRRAHTGLDQIVAGELHSFLRQ